MKLLVDETIAQSLITHLRAEGHALVLAAEVTPGLSDGALLTRARQLGVVVLTDDAALGDLVLRQGFASAGLILLRLAGLARADQPGYVAQMLATHAAALPGAFTRITTSSVDIRPLPS
jgi:predicted nuclease of predicted toxin-antitoxin system